MKTDRKLYQITAHFAYSTSTYYVVAATTTKAEEAVQALHEKRGFITVDWFESKTLAEDAEYGKPEVLLLT